MLLQLDRLSCASRAVACIANISASKKAWKWRQAMEKARGGVGSSEKVLSGLSIYARKDDNRIDVRVIMTKGSK